MQFVGPLYIFSKHHKFMYLLTFIDGEVIDHMFHVSRLKWGLLRLPNGKSVKNINDYKLAMVKLRNTTTPTQSTDAPHTSQTSVKSVLHLQLDHKSDTCDTSDTHSATCQPASIFQTTSMYKQNDLLLSYHTHDTMVPHTDTLHDTVFVPVDQLQESCHSFTVSKCRFKFSNLQIYCFYSNAQQSSGIWETIQRLLEKDFITSMLNLKIQITGSRQKYVSHLFKYL